MRLRLDVFERRVGIEARMQHELDAGAHAKQQQDDERIDVEQRQRDERALGAVLQNLGFGAPRLQDIAPRRR